ncbi:hypothetical protein HT136_18390 [Novosphingobium profundi]|uniref:hypothetical protein n=1 Tax=Novosphingobium profundi TaxID=1774954 RepID=UPI001BD9406B|nr:hypothetical protein [Novosphingobium profundi]MBT0670340.1 hypothetical protein [Novosphingobium profundi]
MASTLDGEAAIERLALAMIACTLPKAQWTHEAHFALALWLARHRHELTAPDALRALITRYNMATGTANSDTSGYHHTITRASMRGVRAQLDVAGERASLDEILKGLMASPLGRADWLLAYWSRDVLFGVAARRTWVEPDLAPLPW